MRRKNTRKPPKVDFNINEKEKIENMISSYKQVNCTKVPLQINSKLVVMVLPEDCNEHYRQRYIKRHNI